MKSYCGIKCINVLWVVTAWSVLVSLFVTYSLSLSLFFHCLLFCRIAVSLFSSRPKRICFPLLVEREKKTKPVLKVSEEEDDEALKRTSTTRKKETKREKEREVKSKRKKDTERKEYQSEKKKRGIISVV